MLILHIKWVENTGCNSHKNQASYEFLKDEKGKNLIEKQKITPGDMNNMVNKLVTVYE